MDEETQLKAGSQLWGGGATGGSGSGTGSRGDTSYEQKAAAVLSRMADRGVDVGGREGIAPENASVSVVPSEDEDNAMLRRAGAGADDAVGQSTARVGLSEQDADMKSRRHEGAMPRRLLPASGTAAE